MPSLWSWLGIEQITAQLDRIEAKLDAMAAKEAGNWLKEEERDMAERDELANLVQRIEENSDAVDSARMALEGYLTKVTDLTTQLEAAIANGGDVSPDIRDAADAIRRNTEELRAAIPEVAEAVAQNTEAE